MIVLRSSDIKFSFQRKAILDSKKIISSIEYSEKDSIDLIVYYSGEGTTYNNQKVLIPYDANLSKSASFYSVQDLYSGLEKLQSMPEVGDVTLFMDVDFNNASFKQNIKRKSEKE